MSRADLMCGLARHQRKALFLELELSVLDEQPRRLGPVLADHGDCRPAVLIDEVPQPLGIVLVDLTFNVAFQ